MKRHLDLLAPPFMVPVLPPGSGNIGKRAVKAPKVYVAAASLLHSRLDIPSARALEAHPKIGASFEGFALREVVRVLHARREQCYFWAAYQGAELRLRLRACHSRARSARRGCAGRSRCPRA